MTVSVSRICAFLHYTSAFYVEAKEVELCESPEVAADLADFDFGLDSWVLRETFDGL